MHHLWREVLDNLKTPNEDFPAVKWNKTKGNCPIALLKESNTNHVNPTAKEDYLFRTLLTG